MMNLKNKLKYSIFSFLSLCSPLLSYAGELTVFDDPGLVIFQSKNVLQGYYSANEGKYSCDFFIMNNPDEKIKNNGSNGARVRTFSLTAGSGKFAYGQRDPWFDIDGNIFRNGDVWVMQTDTEVPACDQVVSGFSKEGARKDFLKKAIFPAIGIRVVRKKVHLYAKIKDGYAKQRSYLVQDDVVALLEEKGKFSKIRYVNPDLDSKSGGKYTIGWIYSNALADPFPQSSDQ